jgi:hypothetical protein
MDGESLGVVFWTTGGLPFNCLHKSAVCPPCYLLLWNTSEVGQMRYDPAAQYLTNTPETPLLR